VVCPYLFVTCYKARPATKLDLTQDPALHRKKPGTRRTAATAAKQHPCGRLPYPSAAARNATSQTPPIHRAGAVETTGQRRMMKQTLIQTQGQTQSMLCLSDQGKFESAPDFLHLISRRLPRPMQRNRGIGYDGIVRVKLAQRFVFPLSIWERVGVREIGMAGFIFRGGFLP